MAWAMRLSRVSSRLASAIHSTYSRLQLGLKASKTAAAFLFFLRAAENSGEALGAGLGAFTTLLRAAMMLVCSPLSMRAEDWRIQPSICFSDGRSLTDVILPRLPIP